VSGGAYDGDMPIPTRGFARILAYVLLASVTSRAAALREHVSHGHAHPHGLAHPHAHANGRVGAPAEAVADRAPALTGATS
jgi:hypothetical protein